METLFERWCESSPRWRVLCWCLSVLFLGSTTWGMALRPVAKQVAELQRQVSEAAQVNVSLWPAASQVPRRHAPREATVMTPFSPLEFQGAGTRLVHWKPLQNGGELTLDAEWQAIPTVFSRLAQRDVQVAAFALSAQGSALRLRVELEEQHAK